LEQTPILLGVFLTNKNACFEQALENLESDQIGAKTFSFLSLIFDFCIVPEFRAYLSIIHEN